jgi:hypothetical protein
MTVGAKPPPCPFPILDRRYFGFSRRLFSPSFLGAFTARLKSCPDTKHGFWVASLLLHANTEQGDKQRRLVRADDEAIHICRHAANAIQTAAANIRAGEFGMRDVRAA